MAKISVTTNEGEVIAIITEDEMGNLNKSIAQSSLMIDILDAVKRARSKEENDMIQEKE